METTYLFAEQPDSDESRVSCADWMPADQHEYCQVAIESHDEGGFWALAGAYPE